MSLIIEWYYFYSNTVSINVKTCFVVLVGILIIHSPYLKHEKAVFIYVNIFFSDSPLINTPRLLIHDAYVGTRSVIRTLPQLFRTEECVF